MKLVGGCVVGDREVLEKKNKGRHDYISLYTYEILKCYIYTYICIYISRKKTPSFINAMICLENQKRVTYIESIKVKIQIQKDG